MTKKIAFENDSSIMRALSKTIGRDISHEMCTRDGRDMLLPPEIAAWVEETGSSLRYTYDAMIFSRVLVFDSAEDGRAFKARWLPEIGKIPCYHFDDNPMRNADYALAASERARAEKKRAARVPAGSGLAASDPLAFVAAFMKRNPSLMLALFGGGAMSKAANDADNWEYMHPGEAEHYLDEDDLDETPIFVDGRPVNRFVDTNGYLDATHCEVFGVHLKDSEGQGEFVVLRDPAGLYYLGPYIGD